MSSPTTGRDTSSAVVALGGGHGLAASLTALRHVTDRITAVVTVADDGGSSGRLREELGVLPPGDLRMALAALCDDSSWGRTWRDLLQYRFESEGDLDHHAVGNLLIAALWQLLGDATAGLDLVGRLLQAKGRVLPMSSVPLDIEADVVLDEAGQPERTTIRGQSMIATTAGHVERLRLDPGNPPACGEAVEAVRAADWIVLGPGSWFTSVLPHLMVPELRDALVETHAKRCVTMNLSTNRTETSGYTAADHLTALRHCAPGFRIDAVIADPVAAGDTDELDRVARSMGAVLVVRQVRMVDGSARHEPLRLAAAYRDVFDGCWGDIMPAGPELGE